jgi:Cyclin D1 binding domain
MMKMKMMMMMVLPFLWWWFSCSVPMTTLAFHIITTITTPPPPQTLPFSFSCSSCRSNMFRRPSRLPSSPPQPPPLYQSTNHDNHDDDHHQDQWHVHHNDNDSTSSSNEDNKDENVVSSSSSHSDDDDDDSNIRHRELEFGRLGPTRIYTSRLQRWQQEAHTLLSFEAYGNPLWELRHTYQVVAQQLQQQIRWQQQQQQQQQLVNKNDHHPNQNPTLSIIAQLQQQLLQLKRRDPEYVYQIALRHMEYYNDDDCGDDDGRRRRTTGTTHTPYHHHHHYDNNNIVPHSPEEESIPMNYTQMAMSARSCLPQFNYHGLWMGRYGPTAGSVDTTTHNAAALGPYDIINITYVGDLLMATKLTSHHGNVPSGEITFQVDLNPLRYPSSSSLSPNGPPPHPNEEHHPSQQQQEEGPLPPIQLSHGAANKWGVQKVSRYRGLGQVAATNYTHSHWMTGQLIVISTNYFSFVWWNDHGAQQQIFFGRPPPEIVLNMLSQPAATTTKPHAMPYRTPLPPPPPSSSSSLPQQQQQLNDNWNQLHDPLQHQQHRRAQSSQQQQQQRQEDIQTQQDYMQRCYELTYEEVLDEMDEEIHNPYGGLWHCHDDENNNNDDDRRRHFE